ncbi:cell division cycle and apoptosis regulator protein 1 [Agrilus planipennis]|uniref:Cell division cycle and apoptosis regulator protein 1 n=1 Tax=Agrilus planipennis TaxID=224129 RepID=A0A7F5RNH5_AGRPL|nr:cell division cycle and apoptosis regulator protein 1 [Agrilus planipennis]
MSNLGAFGGAKNPPWARNSSPANLVNQNPNLQQQIMNPGAFGGMNATGMVQLQQHQQVLQNAMNMQQQNINLGLQQLANTSVAVSAGLTQQIASNPLFQQVGAVTYPNPRALNPSAFQTQVVSAAAGVQSSNNSSTKQRVFTGTVTKVHDNFGFVDDDVFFQTTATKGSNPIVGDRVLVEATYNPNMPFKWNATRMQVLPSATQGTNIPRGSNNPKGGNYNNISQMSDGNGGFGKSGQRTKGSIGGRGRERSRTRDEEEENERKRRKEERIRERDRDDKKSPLRRRSRSPKSRRRSRIVPRYMVQIPKISLDLKNADVLEIRRRYGNLYVPSDFFYSLFRWVDAFPPDKPFSLNKPCSFHVMHKDVEPLIENDAVLEPPDADYLFSAKVMLMNVSGLEDMYQKCCALAEDNRRDNDSEDRDYVHPTRLINFLVGVKGKSETMAIGGPWSKSLDGENPEKDPSVLIKTAIRTCKALTGIDLSPCTQWYRFVELYYRRAEAVHRGRTVPARVETVVLFLPDVWSCLPTRLEWDALTRGYQAQLENRIAAEGDDAPAVATSADHEKEEDATCAEKLEPTPYTELDIKTMTVAALRNELKARNLSAKGLKSQLVARLQKALKAEAEKIEGGKDEPAEAESEGTEEKKSEADEKKIDEKERHQLEKRYALPDQPRIVVHPNRLAKSGKFDCTVMSLSLLLDYRPEDTKEHTFEVSLFAELFNEMLMRDFGFNIYRVLWELPEKLKEKEKEKDEKKKKKDEEKKKDDKDDKEKKEEEKKKDKDDKKKEDKDKHRENKEGVDKDRKSEESKDDKKDEKKKEAKKDDKRSEKDDDSDDDDDYDRRSDRDKRRKERLKMFTKDRNLLLSFTYFDQTHCGYIFEKDMEDLLFTLGLNLSRAQVRKLVGKVVSRDSLHYRKLTDKPKEDDFIVIDDSEKECYAHELARGNKKFLPVFQTDEVSAKKQKLEGPSSENTFEEGLIMFRGAMVDVSKLMAQLERSEKARVATESYMVDLKTENNRLNEKNGKQSSTIKSLNSEMKEYKEKLKHTEDVLSKVSVCSKLFQATLLDIRDKIDPVLKSASHIKDEIKRERDGDRERKHEESKSRWERNPKEKGKDVKEKEAVVKEDKDKEKEKDKGDEKDKEKEKDKDKERELEKEKAKDVEKNGKEVVKKENEEIVVPVETEVAEEKAKEVETT